MTKAFVMIVCEPGSDDNIISKLRSLEIVNVHGIFGPYDIIVQLNSDSVENLENVITKKIRRLEKILKTITLLTEKRIEVLDEVFAKKQRELHDKDIVETFIIVSCKNMNEYDTLLNLSKIPEIIDCDVILGHEIILCKASAPTYNDIEDVVTKKIRKFQGVTSTMTLNIIPDKKLGKFKNYD
jgi:DNA-binding Lrp family transcriptional regulator